eukprot:PhF_6_TR24926/c0_g1_i1/m.34310
MEKFFRLLPVSTRSLSVLSVSFANIDIDTFEFTLCTDCICTILGLYRVFDGEGCTASEHPMLLCSDDDEACCVLTTHVPSGSVFAFSPKRGTLLQYRVVDSG